VKRKKPKPKIIQRDEPEPVVDSTSVAGSEIGLGTGPDGIYRVSYETQYFGYGHFMLRPEAKKSMDNLAEILSTVEYQTVNVLAYTDQLGTDTFNIDLSAKRGKAIRAYLALRGIPLEKINVVARGELKPDQDEDHIYRRIFSRKVELVIDSKNPIELKTAKTYIVTKDITPIALAEALGISSDDIIEWNGIREEMIAVGSTIRLFDLPSDIESSSNAIIDEDGWNESLQTESGD
jgi:outer membrane protein OmpA-like peptidoglycan-associated protein